MRLIKRELAAKLNVSERSLTSWAREGMPVLEHGRRGAPSYYDLAAVLRWITQTRDPSKVRVNIVALERELGIGTRPPAIDARVIARAIAQARVVFFEVLDPDDTVAPPDKLAEELGLFNYMLCCELARSGIAGVGEILDATASEADWPVALEDIIARARAEVPPR